MPRGLDFLIAKHLTIPKSSKSHVHKDKKRKRNIRASGYASQMQPQQFGRALASDDNYEPFWADMGEEESNHLLDNMIKEQRPAVLDTIEQDIENNEEAFDEVDMIPIPPDLRPLQPEPLEDEFGNDSDSPDNLDAGQEERDMTTTRASTEPPSGQSSIPDLSQEVEHIRAKSEMSQFGLAFGLWCETTGISRNDYAGLLEVLGLLQDLNEIKTLPKTITTIKKHVSAQLPLIKLRHQDVAVASSRIPTGKQKSLRKIMAAMKKQSTESMHFFDPTSLFSTIIASDRFREKIHIGMAHFVDRPSELFESMAWATSIRAASGQYARTPNGRPVFPSDSVYYRCENMECFCNDAEATKSHMGRILAVGRDLTASAIIPGGIQLIINPLLPPSQFRERFDLRSNANSKELVLVTRQFERQYEQQVVSIESSIYYDHDFEGFGDPANAKKTLYSTRYVVRVCYDSRTRGFDPLSLCPPTRGELELAQYGRPRLAALADERCISIPVLTFIDAFGLYRNMYRALLGIYAMPAGLNWRERKRQANMLALALGPHAASFEDIIRVLQPGLSCLDEGTKINVNGEEVTLLVFTLAFLGDMKQQNESCGLLSALGNRGCSKCLIPKDRKQDLSYNIMLNARSHYQILQQRAKADAMNPRAAKNYLDGLNMQAQQTPLVRIAPTLDLIRSRPHDPAHSEFSNLGKEAQRCLLDAILVEDAIPIYQAHLSHFPFPPGWARLQSLHHLGSYQMQEVGRLSIITPILLRIFLKPDHVRPLYLKAVQSVMTPSMQLHDVDAIVACFAAMAKTNTLILALSMSPNDRTNLLTEMRASRKAYQRLYQCAALASASGFKHGHLPISSRNTTPAVSQAPDEEEEGDDEEEYEASDLHSLGRSDYESLRESFTVDGTVSKKSLAFKKHMMRPSVHVGLHYGEVAEEYATPNNVNCLAGENKHRCVISSSILRASTGPCSCSLDFAAASLRLSLNVMSRLIFYSAVTKCFSLPDYTTNASLDRGYKADIMHSNFRNVTRFLLTKDAIYQTLRFVLAGSFAFSDPGITQKLQALHISCPTLLNALLPTSEKADPQDAQTSRLSVQSDRNHMNALGIGCINKTYVQKELGFPLVAADVPTSDDFVLRLRKAYEREYHERNAEWGKRSRFQWCQKLVFTDPWVSPFLQLSLVLVIPEPPPIQFFFQLTYMYWI